MPIKMDKSSICSEEFQSNPACIFEEKNLNFPNKIKFEIWVEIHDLPIKILNLLKWIA